MHADSVTSAFITLTEAAKVTPGRPSTNCLWRWCRRGVLSRGGERVRLEHRRVGGKIFTTTQWLEEFGRRLAEADMRHFELTRAAAAEAAAKEPHGLRGRRRAQPSNVDQRALRAIEDAERELDEAGIQ